MDRTKKLGPVQCLYKAVMLVSIGQAKLATLEGKQLGDKLTKLAAYLRSQQFVRQIECVALKDWKDAANPKATVKDAPWKPYGAFLVIEAENENSLNNAINAVFDAAKKVDQEAMTLDVLDIW